MYIPLLCRRMDHLLAAWLRRSSAFAVERLWLDYASELSRAVVVRQPLSVGYFVALGGSFGFPRCDV